MTQLSTGISALDRRLSGGLDPGSLLAIVASPATQSEALLHTLMEERPSVYVTTVRRAEAIREDVEGIDRDVRVEYAGVSATMDSEFLKKVAGNRTKSLASVAGDTRLDDVYEVLHDVDDQRNVIVDSTNALEHADKPGAYQEVLNELKSTVLDTDSLGILHCITEETSPPLRETTLMIADVVWEVELVSLKNEREYQLTMPKNRRGDPMLEEISLVIESDVWIDDSRNI